MAANYASDAVRKLTASYERTVSTVRPLELSLPACRRDFTGDDMGSAAYDRDFYGWTKEQATLLRAGQMAELDTGNLIEEIESMGRSERRQMTNRFELLLMHLLKWQYQPDRREIDGKSWLRTIREQRRKIPKLIRDNPSLQSLMEECVKDAYEDARFAASDETALLVSVFPELCPYTLEQILELEFLPNSIGAWG